LWGYLRSIRSYLLRHFFMATTKNERNTENLVRDQLRNLGYYRDDNDIQVEEQKSNIEAVKRLLKTASKTGKGNTGAPEFIISAASTADFLVVIECKADPRDHSSPEIREALDADALLSGETEDAHAKRTQRYALDGALHYARFLSKSFHVIAIGVSGEKSAALTISCALHPKGAIQPKWLLTRAGAAVEQLLPWDDFITHGTFDSAVQRQRLDDLMAFSRELHDFMRDHAKLTESEKPLLVSGTLIALRNKAFALSYSTYSPAELQQEWMLVIRKEIDKTSIPQAKKENMTVPYSSIGVHPELGKKTPAYPMGVLHELIDRLYQKVWPFISIYHDFDIVGQFYGEFLKYTGGDKKALGIVLTPRHITELFARLAHVTKTSKVLDICTGTGGFLISAMQQMLAMATTEAEAQSIRQERLIGVEQLPNMFALAASNMILRGDGKANLYQGSCFDEGITEAVKKHQANVGLLNPPFSQGDAGLHELQFILKMLDCLEPGGTGVVIVPMSCAIAPHPLRHQLLQHHTLEAVMSMPDELFYPVGTVTCIMVFTAKVPHAVSARKSWFGYWKTDGFIKTKHRGRIDPQHQWQARSDRWVEQFRNREVHPGESVLKAVTAQDEWCAEAYMETDYSKITRADFERVVRNYAVFKMLGAKIESDNEEAE
jgi:hypothetical protein